MFDFDKFCKREVLRIGRDGTEVRGSDVMTLAVEPGSVILTVMSSDFNITTSDGKMRAECSYDMDVWDARNLKAALDVALHDIGAGTVGTIAKKPKKRAAKKSKKKS